MKLFIGAVALTMALTACSGSGGGSKGNTKEVDGNYVSFSKLSGDKYTMDYTEIKDGSVTHYDVDLDNGTYSLTRGSLNVAAGGKAKVQLHSHSCIDLSQPGVIEDSEDPIIKVEDGVLKVTDSEGTESELQINDQEAQQIKKRISELELLQGDGCVEKMNYEGKQVSVEETRQLLKKLLESEE